MTTGRKTIWQQAEECAGSLDGTFTRQEIASWFRRHYPETKASSVQAHVEAATSNSPSRVHYPAFAARTPLFYRIDRGLYRRYLPGDEVADVTTTRLANTAPIEPARGAGGTTSGRAIDEWSWEGNVSSAVASYLASKGVRLVRIADTHSRERGTDIIADSNGRPLHIEVKGWPSDRYVDDRRADEVKRTQPVLQARTWFDGGTMSVLRLRSANPEDLVALALPDKPTYRRLTEAIRPVLAQLGIDSIWLSETGAVEVDHRPLQTSGSGPARVLAQAAQLPGSSELGRQLHAPRS